MSTLKKQSDENSKGATVKAPQAKPATPKAKTTAELIEEQKQFFESKNQVIRKLKVFDKRGKDLQDVLDEINSFEASNSESIFEEQRTPSIIFKDGYNEVCTISTPVIIRSVIKNTLTEIEEKRNALELELLSK